MPRLFLTVSLSVLLAALGGSVAPGSSLAQSWVQIAPANIPAPRDDAVLVYDPVREELLLFGGHILDASDETWTLEGDVWTQKSPAQSPPPRRSAYGIWDSARNRVVVFGGSAAGQIDRSEMWSWDGTGWSSSTPAASPPERRDAAVAYDSTRDRIVLFGGTVDGAPDVTLADTWEFDGSTWVETTPVDSPGDRAGALMGYDPVRELIVMINGASEADGTRMDTWVYAGGAWTVLPDANAPRGQHLEMTWDPAAEKLLVVGAKNVTELSSWHFDGAVWTEHAESTFALNGGQAGALAYEAGRGYALYLRTEGGSYQGYRLREASWDLFLPLPQPGGIDSDRGAIVFDEGAGEVRLFGDARLTGTLEGWRWDGIMWRLMELASADLTTSPAAVVYDAARDVTVAHSASTVVLEGTSWMHRTPSQSPPRSGSMAYDPSRGRIVYFGGVVDFAQYSDATWTWDGTEWEELTVTASPPARWRAAMAYDERRQKMVLFGGSGRVGGQVRDVFDTWELDGNTWTEVAAAGPDRLRGYPVMAYDRGRERIVLWAEQGSEDAQAWEYDGSAWIGTEPPPIEGAEGLLGYDDAGQRLLLHDTEGRTWARTSGATPPGDGGPGDIDGGAMIDSDGSIGQSDGGGAAGDGGLTDGPDGAMAGADGSAGGGTDRGARDDGGCGCRTVDPQAGGEAWMLAMLLGLVLALRRRPRKPITAHDQ